MVQPEHAEREDAVDDDLGLRRADANNGPGLVAADERAACIGRTEGTLEVHRGTEAVGLPVSELTRQNALQQAQVGLAGRFPAVRFAPVQGGG